jgi:hypothetical protein
MMNLAFILAQFVFISLFDIWQMAKAEILYWNRGWYDQAASENTSLGQFAFWYAEVIVCLIGYYGLSWKALIVLMQILFLHYSGLEDYLFFVFATWIKLPEIWWTRRESVKILFWRLPAIMPWLSEPRIGIPSLWMPLWGGQQVSAKGLTQCVSVSLLLVVIFNIMIMLRMV